jgi:chorismate mutase
MKMFLVQIRKNIDTIDGEILSLLHQRLQLALQTRSFKTRVGDPAREREILDNLRKKMSGYPLLRTDFVLGLFKEILKESRRVQRRSRHEKEQEVQP